MTTPKIERLTPAQAERLTSFRREWFEIGTNTDRADRAKAEAAIMAMRAEIGVKTKPTFVWCASPATSLLALHAIKSPQWQKLVGDRLGDPLRGSLRDSLRDPLRGSLWGSLRGSLGDSLLDPLWGSLRGSLGGSLRDSLEGSLWGSLRDSLLDPLLDPLWGSLRGSLRDSLRGSLGDLATSIGSAWFGQHEAYWIAFYLFLSRYPWCQI